MYNLYRLSAHPVCTGEHRVVMKPLLSFVIYYAFNFMISISIIIRMCTNELVLQTGAQISSSLSLQWFLSCYSENHAAILQYSQYSGLFLFKSFHLPSLDGVTSLPYWPSSPQRAHFSTSSGRKNSLILFFQCTKGWNCNCSIYKEVAGWITKLPGTTSVSGLMQCIWAANQETKLRISAVITF